MCRLFGMHAGQTAVAATFWLVDAPDSLSEQSRRNPDGAGIAAFTAGGQAVVDKQPIAAWQDVEFATAARELRATTFVAHVRYASTGALTMDNTHPFLEQGRVFAHNGVVEGLAEMDARLAELGATDLPLGQTDSERVFALITAETARCAGDIEAGIDAAITWISANVGVYSVNFILATATDLWALRYPSTNPLYVLDRSAVDARAVDRGAGAASSEAVLDARSSRIHARSIELAQAPVVLLATERMDDDPGWRPLACGELLHVDRHLQVTTSIAFPAEPAHLLTHDQLGQAAAASQQPIVAT